MYWGYKCESCCCLSFAHQTDLTPKIFSAVAPCSLVVDTHQNFRSFHHPEVGGDRFLSDDVTHTPAYSGWTKVTSNIIITTLRTSDLILYDTQQVFEILAKIWLIWDCKCRYLIVIWGHMVVHLVETLHYRGRVWFLKVTLEFFIDIIFLAALCPWGSLIL